MKGTGVITIHVHTRHKTVLNSRKVHAGVAPAQRLWHEHASWADPDGMLAALHEAADAAAVLPPAHRLVSKRAEQHFVRPPPKRASAIPAWRAATAPPVDRASRKGGRGRAPGVAAVDSSDEFEPPVRRVVSLCAASSLPCQSHRDLSELGMLHGIRWLSAG